MATPEKNKQLLMVGGILGGMAFIIIVYFYLMYARPGMEKLDTQIGKLETEMAKNKKKLADYEAWLNDDTKRRQLEQYFARLSQRLPSDPDPFRVFDLLRDAFDGTGVNFTRLEPLDSKSYGPISYHPFKVAGSARYHEFGQLVNFVECNPERIMRVSSITLKNNSKRPSIHPMEIGIATFTLNQ